MRCTWCIKYSTFTVIQQTFCHTICFKKKENNLSNLSFKSSGAKANNSDVMYLLGIALGGSGTGDKEETLLYLEQGGQGFLII